MRLIYVYGAPLPSQMASAVNVTKMCAAFAADGLHVTLIHYKGRGDIFRAYGLRDRFTTLGIPLRPQHRGSIRIIAWIAAFLARATGATVYSRSTAFLLPAAKLGCPVVYEMHAPLGPEARGSRTAFSTLLQGKQLRSVICISNALAENTVQEWPQTERLLFVYHDGADRAPISSRINAGVQVHPLLGYAGHLYEGKGMEIISALAEARPDWNFLIVGGRPTDLAHWRLATSQCRNIEFAGMIPHSEVASRLSDCDVLLAPYLRKVIVSDGRTDVASWMSPLKLFEYMALAKPIVASDLPVIREILRDGENARLAPPEDTKQWERIIADLLADGSRAATLGQRARHEIDEKYNWRHRARAIRAAISR